jgi:5,10-methenyltetrahydromethanopterin hydrogenase
MKVIFKNPISQKFEVGIVVKAYTINKMRKYDIISEKGIYHPALSTNIQKKGYISEKYTEKFVTKIVTNLSKETQGNYKDIEFTPNILKIDI